MSKILTKLPTLLGMLSLSLAAVALATVSLPTRALADVFHGEDRDTKREISRTAVDTETPPGAFGWGFKVLNDHASGSVTLSLTSLDKEIKNINYTKVVLIVDGMRFPITYDHYNEMFIAAGLPTLHELWYKPFTADLKDALLKSKEIVVEVTNSTGGFDRRRVKPIYIGDVKEAIRGKTSL